MCRLPERNFLVTLASADDGKTFAFKLTSPCVCDLDQWVADNAARFPISNPRVVSVDDKAAFHLPLTSGEEFVTA
jgi:hypothetical protein